MSGRFLGRCVAHHKPRDFFLNEATSGSIRKQLYSKDEARPLVYKRPKSLCVNRYLFGPLFLKLKHHRWTVRNGMHYYNLLYFRRVHRVQDGQEDAGKIIIGNTPFGDPFANTLKSDRYAYIRDCCPYLGLQNFDTLPTAITWRSALTAASRMYSLILFTLHYYSLLLFNLNRIFIRNTLLREWLGFGTRHVFRLESGYWPDIDTLTPTTIHPLSPGFSLSPNLQLPSNTEN